MQVHFLLVLHLLVLLYLLVVLDFVFDLRRSIQETTTKTKSGNIPLDKCLLSAILKRLQKRHRNVSYGESLDNVHYVCRPMSGIVSGTWSSSFVCSDLCQFNCHNCSEEDDDRPRSLISPINDHNHIYRFDNAAHYVRDNHLSIVTLPLLLRLLSPPVISLLVPVNAPTIPIIASLVIIDRNYGTDQQQPNKLHLLIVD